MSLERSAALGQRFQRLSLNRIYQETTEPRPTSVVLRPHHFFVSGVRLALARRGDPRTLAIHHYNDIVGCRRADDPTGYYADALGTARNRAGIISLTGDYFTQLRDIPDDGVIRLDIQPDGLCDSCPVGKHCRATNFQGPRGIPGNLVRAEEGRLNDILKLLKNIGSQYWGEFWREKTSHILYDLKGQPLSSPQKGDPKKVTFNALVVKARVLRWIS